MLFLENQRRLGRRVKHGCVVAGPCFALYSGEAAWGRWGERAAAMDEEAAAVRGSRGGVVVVSGF